MIRGEAPAPLTNLFEEMIAEVSYENILSFCVFCYFIIPSHGLTFNLEHASSNYMKIKAFDVNSVVATELSEFLICGM